MFIHNHAAEAYDVEVIDCHLEVDIFIFTRNTIENLFALPSANFLLVPGVQVGRHEIGSEIRQHLVHVEVAVFTHLAFMDLGIWRFPSIQDL